MHIDFISSICYKISKSPRKLAAHTHRRRPTQPDSDHHDVPEILKEEHSRVALDGYRPECWRSRCWRGGEPARPHTRFTTPPARIARWPVASAQLQAADRGPDGLDDWRYVLC